QAAPSPLATHPERERQRSLDYPTSLASAPRRVNTLRAYAARGSEEARQAAGQIFGLENTLKALGGEYQGLRDQKLMEKKQTEERDFRNKLQGNPEWVKKYASAWDAIAGAERERRVIYERSRFQTVRGSRITALGQNLVRYI